jgi:hypothetical protein
MSVELPWSLIILDTLFLLFLVVLGCMIAAAFGAFD